MALLEVGDVVRRAVFVVVSAVGTSVTVVPQLPGGGAAAVVVGVGVVATGVALVGAVVIGVGVWRARGWGVAVGAVVGFPMLLWGAVLVVGGGAGVAVEPGSVVLHAVLGVVLVV
ncbi:MAG: hypothetical protein ABWY11_04935, partial [Umezawaea sp.]